MNKRGYVTVFVTLILVVFMIIITVVLHVTDDGYAQTKASTALSSAISSELAEYNRYIYDRYHILLIDKEASGSGEGTIENNIRTLLEYDLGDEFEVNEVELSGVKGIMDDSCSEFDRQINQNFKYDAAKYTADMIMDKTAGNDEPVDGESISQIETDIGNEQGRIKKEQEAETSKADLEEDTDGESSDNEDKNKEKKKEDVDDPRETLKKYTDAGLVSLILPPDAELSDEEVTGELPSAGRSKGKEEDIDTDFKEKGKLETDTMKGNGWGKSLLTGSETVVYANTYFNCLTDKKFDDTVLNLEMEYLVGGGKNDGENIKKVVNRILLIRFGFNFAYIITDSVKMGECDTLALALCPEAPFMQPVIKYLLAGCWSYIESVMDVYRLLRNHKVPYVKSATTWITDFESMAHLGELAETAEDDENGLDYKDYLLILMALQGDNLKYRILDLIQINTNKNDDKSFLMKNGVTAIGVNADINYKSSEISLYEEAGY